MGGEVGVGGRLGKWTRGSHQEGSPVIGGPELVGGTSSLFVCSFASVIVRRYRQNLRADRGVAIEWASDRVI
jgi:hypothetical protein